MRKDAPSAWLYLPEWWKRPLATCALGLLGVCCALAAADPAPPAPAAETYTSAYEKAPHPHFVDSERTAQWAQTEQDKYRLRVVIPDKISPEDDGSSEAQAEGSQSGDAEGKGPPGGHREESQTLTYV